MVKIYYIYGEPDYHDMVKILLYSWSVIYYIYGLFLLHYGWLL